jgi:hypothetical protein
MKLIRDCYSCPVCLIAFTDPQIFTLGAVFVDHVPVVVQKLTDFIWIGSA